MLSTGTRPSAGGPWTAALAEPACRLCGARLHRTLIDLGPLPLANRTVAADEPDPGLFGLHVRICDECTLVQLADAPETVASAGACLPARFAACPAQARRQAETARKRWRLDAKSLVIEVGSHDGTLLRHFQAAGAQVLGIEPDPAPAAAALEAGIPTEIAPFNTETAMQVAVRFGRADLVVAINVLPHARDLFDFAAGLACILRPNGVLTVQVPHLLALVQKLQFDAFRHDSYSYLSLRVLEHVLRSVGLRVFDAERLPDHGGSVRVHACHAVAPHSARFGLKAVRLAEAGDRDQEDLYTGFAGRVAAAQDEIREFLRTRHAAGRRVAGYGVAARGSMLLNRCGITTAEIACVAGPDPAMHGRLLPGSRIPVVPVETLLADPPDDVIILPWPDAAEIALKLAPLRQRGTHLWTPLPRIVRV
jgi:C-methyltransferase C-terminal domain/Methyltransferase domain/Putative zinc binding domain